LKVLTRCRTENYTQNIGPFANAVNLGDIKVNLKASAAAVIISGTSLKCGTNQPLDSGTVTLYLDGSVYQSKINQGRYSFMANRCSAYPTTADIIISDNTLHLERDTLFNVTAGNYAANTKNICAIGPPNRIIVWITGTSTINYSVFESSKDSFDLQVSSGVTVISGMKQDGKLFTSFTMRGNVSGSNLPVESIIMTDANGKRYTGSGTATTNINNTDEIIVGDINAFVRDEAGAYYSASISFFIKRKK
jgi:hypothetical protein